MDKLKKGLICVGVCALLMSYYATDCDYQRSYELLDDDSLAYAKYCDGYIYIGDRDFLRTIDCGEGDILVEDKRDYLKDPDVVVLSSSTIKDKNIRNDIIEVIQLYEDEDPSIWDRTTDSMRLEWLMHNISYELQFEQNRTNDVDFDNDDEEKYDNKVLNKILKL